MRPSDIARCYVERWFWTLDQLAHSVGASPETVLELIGNGCAPGAIYVHGNDGSWWSALGRTSSAPEGAAWYSRGAAWGLRRALIAMKAGASPAEAGRSERATFVSGFLEALGTIENASLAFPDCFSGGGVDARAAAARANSEWISWIGGGYGVCLRIFTPQSCIAKESLRAALLLGFEEGQPADRMLRLAEALAGWILPFAPWQRASGTPGRTIDRLLEGLQLGGELSYT